jgi:hypothetical protein
LIDRVGFAPFPSSHANPVRSILPTNQSENEITGRNSFRRSQQCRKLSTAQVVKHICIVCREINIGDGTCVAKFDLIFPLFNAQIPHQCFLDRCAHNPIVSLGKRRPLNICNLLRRVMGEGGEVGKYGKSRSTIFEPCLEASTTSRPQGDMGPSGCSNMKDAPLSKGLAFESRNGFVGNHGPK